MDMSSVNPSSCIRKRKSSSSTTSQYLDAVQGVWLVNCKGSTGGQSWKRRRSMSSSVRHLGRAKLVWVQGMPARISPLWSSKTDRRPIPSKFRLSGSTCNLKAYHPVWKSPNRQACHSLGSWKWIISWLESGWRTLGWFRKMKRRKERSSVSQVQRRALLDHISRTRLGSLGCGTEAGRLPSMTCQHTMDLLRRLTSRSVWNLKRVQPF